MLIDNKNLNILHYFITMDKDRRSTYVENSSEEAVFYSFHYENPVFLIK